jgi:hypothetical protein
MNGLPSYANDEWRCAALLHDVLEDTIVTADDLRKMGYSEAVIKAVQIVTKPSETEYLRRSPSGLPVVPPSSCGRWSCGSPRRRWPQRPINCISAIHGWARCCFVGAPWQTLEVSTKTFGITRTRTFSFVLRHGMRFVGVNVIGVLHRLQPFSNEAADYFWERRDTTTWSPPQVRWTTRALFRWRTKGLFCARFLMIADACLQRGQRREALAILVRAVRVSPVHALRHAGTLVHILLQAPLPQTAAAP